MRNLLNMLVFIVLICASIGVNAATHPLDPAKVASEKVKLTKNEDRFQGYVAWAPKKKMLGGTGLFTSLYVVPVFAKQGDKNWYYVRVDYQGLEWLYLTGKVIFLLDDGSTVVLDDPNSKVASVVETCSSGISCIVTEYVRLAITPEDMQRLATAKSIEVAIYGRDKYTTGYFKPFHQATAIEVLKFGGANGAN